MYTENNKLDFKEPIQFETGWEDIDIDLPNWLIKKVATLMIDRMTHVKDSITESYWDEVKKELSLL